MGRPTKKNNQNRIKRRILALLCSQIASRMSELSAAHIDGDLKKVYKRERGNEYEQPFAPAVCCISTVCVNIEGERIKPRKI